jgi:hypothetical protein
MKVLLQQLPALRTALNARLGPTPASITPDVVDAYIRAIQRKCSFATHHLCVLNGIDWESVDGLGRANAEVTRLLVTLEDGALELRHPAAVADHVYLAFDGLIAAVSNMTDTFGRVINAVYGLGQQRNQASLLAVRGRCKPTSPLGQVLHDPQHCEWLKVVKALRGRCQHEDVEEVLLNPAGVYSRRAQPLVPKQYCWLTPAADLPVSAFADAAAEAAVTTLVASTNAVIASPMNPTL